MKQPNQEYMLRYGAFTAARIAGFVDVLVFIAGAIITCVALLGPEALAGAFLPLLLTTVMAGFMFLLAQFMVVNGGAMRSQSEAFYEGWALAIGNSAAFGLLVWSVVVIVR